MLMQVDWPMHFETQDQSLVLDTRTRSDTRQATSDLSPSGTYWPPEGKPQGKLRVTVGFRRKQGANLLGQRIASHRCLSTTQTVDTHRVANESFPLDC